MKTVIIAIVVIVALLGGGAALLVPAAKARFEAMAGEGEVTRVRMQAAQHGELVETIPAPGKIEPHTNVDISATIVAEIVDLPFREGENVSRGDVVVQLDDRDLLARLDAASASLESAHASLVATEASRERTQAQLDEQMERHKGLAASMEFAQRNLERRQELFDAGDIPAAELDTAAERVQDLRTQIAASTTIVAGAESSLASADAQILQAKAAVKQAEAEIKLAQEGLRNTVIRSPIDGKVIALNAEVGERVVTGTMNSPGTVIMTIADLSRMKMIAEVTEADVAKVKAGQPVQVRLIAYGDEVFHGVVDRVALQRTPAADGTGYFETEITLQLDERGEIRAGYIANADIEIERHQGIVVPSQCVVDRAIDDLPVQVTRDNPLVDRTRTAIRVVYLVVNDVAVATPVVIGPSDYTHTLVLDGVEEGEMIITGPYTVLDQIKHDQKVVDIEASEAEPSS